MRRYYDTWKFKHPQPSDFKQVMEEVSGKNLDTFFNELKTTGPVLEPQKNRKIKPAFIFSASLFISPILIAIGAFVKIISAPSSWHLSATFQAID